MSDFTELVDLASERLGGKVLAANDDFFAPKENLILATEPVWREGEYTERGKWMDGWETRRRRVAGHDWCLIRLGLPGIVRGVVVDTAYFRGNFPAACSVEVAALEHDPGPEFDGSHPLLREILGRTGLEGHQQNRFATVEAGRATHLLLRIYPDGGVARLRVFGEVVPDPARLRPGSVHDLAAVENGGRVVAASDMFFGHRHHLIYPGPPRGMFDGWETRRRRGPGHDWAIVRLGAAGALERIVVDTSFFKGNAPGWCSIDGSDDDSDARDPGVWRELLPRQPLSPDAVHEFASEIVGHAPVHRVRLNIFPDGGVARLRLFGRPAAADPS